MNHYSNKTKGLIISGLTLFLYGIISENVPIYFFWESKSIGFALLFVGIIFLFSDIIKLRKQIAKKTLWFKIGIGILSFILVVQVIFVFVIFNSDAYKTAKEYIEKQSELINEIGDIENFGLIPTGAISIQSDSKGEIGSANISIIVKGDQAYKKVNITLLKQYSTKWKVIEYK